MKNINYNQVVNTRKLHVIEENFEHIFYLKEYPMATKEYTPSEYDDYKYINGLKKSGKSFFSNRAKYNQAKKILKV